MKDISRRDFLKYVGAGAAGILAAAGPAPAFWGPAVGLWLVLAALLVGRVLERLREADLIVLSTNRLYRTIPRLPERYPVSTEFYKLLFEGKLGYVHEAEFTAYPGLGHLTWPYQRRTDQQESV